MKKDSHIKEIDQKKSYLSNLMSRLDKIIQRWGDLDDSDKKHKINFILPIVQVASSMDAFLEINRDMIGDVYEQKVHLQDALKGFGEEYRRIYGVDITKMGTSDFAPEVMVKIQGISEGKDKLDEKTYNALLQEGYKYEHAHSKVMFNYGKMLRDIYNKCPEEEKKRINSWDIYEFLENTNDIFNVSENSRYFPKDDLENHALLNQLSNYQINLQTIPRFLMDDREVDKYFDTPSTGKKYVLSNKKRDTQLDSPF